MLFWASMACINNKNSIMVGFAFLFVINIIFMAYFTITEIVNVFSKLSGDEPLINLGRFALFFNGTFLTACLICIFIMLQNINGKWKKAKGMTFQLDPYYQNNLDLFILSTTNNLYFTMVLLLFVVLFKDYFNNVNQIDNSNINKISSYPKKIIRFFVVGFVSIWKYIQVSTLENYLRFKKLSTGFPLEMLFNLIWYILAICAAILLCIFKVILPDILNNFFRYLYLLTVPIFSFLLIFYASYELSLAVSFTKLAQQNLI
jgi:hypothetical protein